MNSDLKFKTNEDFIGKEVARDVERTATNAQVPSYEPRTTDQRDKTIQRSEKSNEGNVEP
jgi:hypothetical protein